MKIVTCINNSGTGLDTDDDECPPMATWITLGKQYAVIEDDGYYILIVDDTKEESWFDRERFTVLQDSM